MKNLLFLIFLTTLLACSKDENPPVVTDPCEEIICQNQGVCNDGICECPFGYEGDLCEIQRIPKKVTLTNFVITSFDIEKPDGSGSWDVNSDYPDLYLNFFIGNEEISIYRDNFINEVSNFPVALSYDFVIEANQIEEFIGIQLRDRDEEIDDFLGFVACVVYQEDIVYQEKLSLEDIDGNFELEFDLIYEFF